MNRLLLFLLFSYLLARTGTAGSFESQPYADARVIRFANGTSVDTRIAPMPEPTARMETGTVWLVHLTGPVRQEWLAELRSLGADPICYLAYQTVVCRLWRDAPATDFRTLPFVDWLGPHPTSAKLAPEILSPAPDSSLFTLYSSLFVLSVWPGENPTSVAVAIAGIGADVEDVTGRSVRFRLDEARLPEVAALEPVAWIQECSPARAYNSDVQWVMQVGWRPERPDELSGRRIWAHGIRGQNMVVGLFDTGITTEHDMFIDPAFPVTGPGLFPEHRKLVAYKLYDGAAFGDASGFHGTAVASTLCGNDSIAGNASKLDGVAPDCRIYFVDDGDAYGVHVSGPDLTALLDSVRLSNGVSQPVRQVSGSFGSSENLSYYRLEESSLDAVCWNDKQFFVVWAAGNSGGSAYNIGHPSGAKSALTVGCCGNGTQSNEVWISSSRGPCRDERIKPNLLAPGENVATADGRESHSYVALSGTSLSAPAASGALMLLRQYFAEGWFPTGAPDSSHRITHLSSALMRAMAIAATDSNVGSEYPPNTSAGWGRLDVSTIMHFPDDSSGLAFLDDTFGVSTGEAQSFQFELSGRAPLHVVLAWTDTAAAPEAAIAIVNDLNLELTSPDGNRYHGNQFNAGWSSANPPNWDERNVEEVCLVNHPLPGRWTARVLGRNVYTPRQPFAVAVRGGIAGMVPGVAEGNCPRTETVPKTPFGLSLRPGWHLTVFAVDGRQVFTGTVPQRGLSPKLGLETGVYFYRLASGSAQPITGKLVICR
ncbi:MAG: S8 family serine peptidase [candidate division WOR-3 bacterium]|nr:S8 family serine peptidase [candidate division WOR-3 bacterium]